MFEPPILTKREGTGGYPYPQHETRDDALAKVSLADPNYTPRSAVGQRLLPARFAILAGILVLIFCLSLVACAVTPQVQAPAAGQVQAAPPEKLVIYSGRSESLVGPIIEQFQEASGVEVKVRWGSTGELAATLLEEGDSTPADVFFAQDPGGLGAVKGMLSSLPADILDSVDARFRDTDGKWVGISGRARVIVYNTEAISPEDLPADIWDFTDPKWKGRIGWPPTNGSFQTMVTGMRSVWGEEKTREWLDGIQANEPTVYEKNTPTVAAVGAGEVDVGFVNHYYLFRFLQEEGEGFVARNYFLPGGGPGSLVMVAGAGILNASENQETAQKFLNFMLSTVAQQYFATQTFEYSLVDGVRTHRELPPLSELNAIDIDLADLADLQGTVVMLQDVGVLP